MYTVAVKREFIAQHFLIGGDWGAENTVHSHRYQVEVQLKGATLDAHGYLVDIAEVTTILERLICDYRDRTLNELLEFKGMNPSLEQFARILLKKLSRELIKSDIQRIKMRLWEDESAWASYSENVKCASQS